MKKCARNLWNIFQRISMHFGVPEEERNRSKGKEIRPKNFPNLKKHLNINTQEP